MCADEPVASASVAAAAAAAGAGLLLLLPAATCSVQLAPTKIPIGAIRVDRFLCVDVFVSVRCALRPGDWRFEAWIQRVKQAVTAFSVCVCVHLKMLLQ